MPPSLSLCCTANFLSPNSLQRDEEDDFDEDEDEETMGPDGVKVKGRSRRELPAKVSPSIPVLANTVEHYIRVDEEPTV